MNHLNSVLLEGNLVKDPEVKELPNGSHVCNMTVISDRFYKKDDEYQKEVSFFEITTWGKVAEACKVLKKGRGIRLTGRLKQERWTDPAGNQKMRVKVVAEHIEFKPVFNKTQEEELKEIDDMF